VTVEYFYPDTHTEPSDSTRTFLAKMREAGCRVSVVDGLLRVRAPAGVMTEDRRDRIARHAGALVALLERDVEVSDAA